MTNNNCELCQNPDNDKMVQCDKCDKWHHHDCVGTIEEEVCNVTWICPKCDKPKSRSGKSHKSGTSRNTVLDEETLKTMRELEESELRIEAAKAAQKETEIAMEAQTAQAMATMKTQIAQRQTQILQEQLKIKYANQRLALIRDSDSYKSVSNASSIKRTIEWVENQQQQMNQQDMIQKLPPCNTGVPLPTTNEIIHSTPHGAMKPNGPLLENNNKNTHLQFNQVKGGDVFQIRNYAMQQQPPEVNYDQLTRAQVRARQGIERIELRINCQQSDVDMTMLKTWSD